MLADVLFFPQKWQWKGPGRRTNAAAYKGRLGTSTEEVKAPGKSQRALRVTFSRECRLVFNRISTATSLSPFLGTIKNSLHSWFCCEATSCLSVFLKLLLYCSRCWRGEEQSKDWHSLGFLWRTWLGKLLKRSGNGYTLQVMPLLLLR